MNDLSLHVLNSIHAYEDVSVKQISSLNYNDIMHRIIRNAAQGILTAILKNQCNGVFEAFFAFFYRNTLTVCPWHFRTIGDVPFAIPLENHREFISHGYAPDILL